MIKVENIDVWGFEHAIRGMRNPMNSWDKSDSEWRWVEDDSPINPDDPGMCFVVGDNDIDLMKRLFKAGTEHRKYLRQIFVSMDITAPLYWWKEFDTYKVGTVANSCSTMHKIAAKEFELDDFSHEHLFGDESAMDVDDPVGVLNIVIGALNKWRKIYLEQKDKDQWWQMIQLLPTSYNQKRTVTFNYENVFSIIRQRSGHKLDEWNEFVSLLKYLPYVESLLNS